jgi:hypothetical protein
MDIKEIMDAEKKKLIIKKKKESINHRAAYLPDYDN